MDHDKEARHKHYPRETGDLTNKTVNRFLEWLLRPRLSVRLLQQENARLYTLLREAWERAGVIAPQRTGQAAAPVEQRKSRGEIEAEFQADAAKRYWEWQAEEQQRLRSVNAVTSKLN